MANDSFMVYIYANEYEYLKWLVLQKQDIETGGDLFGVWRNELCPVVQFVLGPGKQCRRTATSFHQSVEYLENVGKHMISNEGICNIGEWHSHHRLGLAHPSSGDERTVWNHIGTVSGGRFLVFIANITGNSVNVGCFMFNKATREVMQGKMEVLVNCSPIRHTFVEVGQFQLEAEPGQDWNTFCMSRLQEASPRWRGSQVGDIESGVRHCACEDSKDKNGSGDCSKIVILCPCLVVICSAISRCGSWAWLKIVNSCQCPCLRAICLAISQCGSWAWLKIVNSCQCLCQCLRAICSAISRCGSWALRLCYSCLLHLCEKCRGRPARD